MSRPNIRSNSLRHVHLIDTSIGSDNIGDEIIVEEAKNHLMPILTDAYITTSAGHDGLGPYSRKLVEQADLVLLLGTNALRAEYRVGKKYIWYVERKDIPLLAGKVVLFGVGANRDFQKVERRQLKFLRTVLSAKHEHAVRDETGADILKACDLRATNTSCPTLWRHPSVTVDPTRRASAVCFTLTQHKADPIDAEMIDVFLKTYDDVWFWPQQPRDLTYLQTLPNADQVKVLPANLQSYDRFLSETDVDVVGTRLHGTIRGLHHGRRALAIAIDNRARDIGREVGLQTMSRAEIKDDLMNRLNSDLTVSLTLPDDHIARFLRQFAP